MSNEIKLDVSSKNNTYNLHRQFVVWSCDRRSVAPLTDYANNEIYQQLPKESDYFAYLHERRYLDLRKSKGFRGELEN